MNETIDIRYLADCPEAIPTLASWVFEQWGQQYKMESVGVQLELFANRTNRDKIPHLDLVEADITAQGFRIDPVSVVFAGLVFEYVDVWGALPCISRCLAFEGILLAVLQQPSTESVPVTTTRYKSFERLSPIMNLVSPIEFSNMCGSVGLQKIKTDTIPLKKGKTFFVGLYRKHKEPSAP